jgi:hypothetical protein
MMIILDYVPDYSVICLQYSVINYPGFACSIQQEEDHQ